MSPIPSAAPIQRALQSDLARQRILDAIVDGTLVPGDRLDDQQLMQWLAVSRSTVRVALDSLASSGLVEIRPRQSARVVAISAESANDARVLLTVLMRGVVTSFLRSDPPRLGAVLELVDRSIAAVQSGSSDKLTAASRIGYLQWAELSPNAVLGAVLAQRVEGLVYQSRGLTDHTRGEDVLAALVCFRSALAGNDLRRARHALDVMHLVQRCRCNAVARIGRIADVSSAPALPGALGDVDR